MLPYEVLQKAEASETQSQAEYVNSGEYLKRFIRRIELSHKEVIMANHFDPSDLGPEIVDMANGGRQENSCLTRRHQSLRGNQTPTVTQLVVKPEQHRILCICLTSTTENILLMVKASQLLSYQE